MLIRNGIIGLLLAVVTTLPVWGQLRAQTTLRGEIGLDLENHIFDKALKDTTYSFLVNRSLSNHYLDLLVSGPLVTKNLATYSIRALTFGTYTRVKTENNQNSAYLKPNLGSYNTSLTLFPARSYPLMLYYNKIFDNNIRYEPNNRSDLEKVQPELAIIRRYQSELISRGGRFKSSLKDKINITSEYKQDKMKISRNYDLDENRNLWVVFTTILADPVSSTHEIEIENSLSDDTVLVYIDYNFIDSLGPGESVSVEADSGYHNADFIPTRYNSYSQSVAVRGDMIWEIIYNPPTTPNDMDQTNNSATAIIHVGNVGKLTNETVYSYNDIREKNQNLITYMGNFSNTANYEFSSSINLNLMTSYSQNQAEIDTISSQLSKSFIHQTTLGLERRKKLSMTFMHSYSRLSSLTGSSYLLSNTHMFSSHAKIPTGWSNHTIDIKNAATMVSDLTGYKNNQYSADIINGFAYRLGKIVIEPKNQTKLSYSTQKNPDQTGNEIENKTTLTGDFPRLSSIGKLRMRGGFNWRRKSAGTGYDTKKKYTLDLSLERRFFSKYKIILAATREKESYGGSTPTPGANPDQSSPSREDQILQTYKIKVQANPVEELILAGDYMIINQNSARIEKFGASLIATIPFTNIPVKSFISAQSRMLKGMPKQTQMMIETKLSYRFRQITLVVSHSYNKENLRIEDYSYQEIMAKISRHFSIM